MKKITLYVVLMTLLLCGLLLSCNSEVNDLSNDLVSISFQSGNSGSKSINSSIEGTGSFEPGNYYWKYASQKNDSTNLISGQTSSYTEEGAVWLFKDSNNNPTTGLGVVNGFSQGVWNFKLFAYKREGAGTNESPYTYKLVFEGEKNSVTLSKNGNHSVVVAVSPLSGSDNGTLSILLSGDNRISLKTNENQTVYAQENIKAKLSIARIGDNGNTPIDMDSSQDGTQENLITVSDQSFSLEPGVYTVNVSFTNGLTGDEEIVYVPGSVVARVYSNLTTTISGQLNEQLTYGDFTPELHNHDYVINTTTGAWVCSECNEILAGTDHPYVTVLDNNGKPTDIVSLTGDLSYAEVGTGTITVSGSDITYEGSTTTGQNVCISTTAGKNLTINAPMDIVNHYGNVGTLTILAVASSSYHEFGAAALAEIKTGRIVLEEASNVAQIHLTKTEDLFNNIIVAKASNVSMPKFSRDSVELIPDTGKLIVAIQDGTSTNANTDYVWLTEIGIFEQVTLSSSSTDAGTTYASDSSDSGKKAAAQEIANNITFTDATDGKCKVKATKTVNGWDYKVVDAETGSSEKTGYNFIKNEATSSSTATITITKDETTVITETENGIDNGYWINCHADRFDSGKGTETNPYIIKTANQLALIAYNVNNGIDGASTAYYKIANDINLSGKYWTPIGTDTNKFCGIFDGNEKTIRNQIIDESDKRYQALFGYVKGTGNTSFNSLLDVWNNDNYSISETNIVEAKYDAVVKNLMLENASVIVSGNNNTTRYTGAVIGCAENAYISNITLRGTNNISGCNAVGGIIGSTKGTIVKNCSTSSATSVVANVYHCGGIVGRNEGSFSMILDCINDASLEKKQRDGYLGGILGFCDDGKYIVIANCVNNGDLTSSGTGSPNGGHTVAGISNGHNCELIFNCVNNGDITATGVHTHVSGIAGYLNTSKKLIYCTNNGNISAYCQNSVNGITDASGVEVVGCINNGAINNTYDSNKAYDISINLKVVHVTTEDIEGELTIANLNSAISTKCSKNSSSTVLSIEGITIDTGTLIIPESINNVVSDNKCCSDVQLRNGLLEICIPNLSQVISSSYDNAISFSGNNNTITVNSEISTGAIVLSGTGTVLNNYGHINGHLQLRGNGATTVNNMQGGSIAGIGLYDTVTATITNRGVIEKTEGYVFYTESPVSVTLYNYGKLLKSSTNLNILLYGNCSAVLYMYNGSEVTGHFWPYNANHVDVYYEDGATINGDSWSTMAGTGKTTLIPLN